MKHRCSSVCGAPESSKISVASAKYPWIFGPSRSTTTTVMPVRPLSYFVIFDGE